VLMALGNCPRPLWHFWHQSPMPGQQERSFWIPKDWLLVTTARSSHLRPDFLIKLWHALVALDVNSASEQQQTNSSEVCHGLFSSGAFFLF
jgi:hypothetical protein